MGKKKLAALLVAGLMTLGAVGGTFAWFTSQDTVTNNFSTGGGADDTNKNDPNAGIKIIENWNGNDAKNITPGTAVNKDVQVTSNVNYDQFVRVKVTKKFYKTVNGQKTEVIPDATNKLSYDDVQIICTSHLSTTKGAGSWFAATEDGGTVYYYIGKVGAKSHTNTLVDKVSLVNTAGNQYKNVEFDVIVNAESIQASNGAYNEWTKTAELKTVYGTLEKGDATIPVDALNATEHNH